MNEQTLVAKVWNLAHVLRDEGVSYLDYLTQISFLLFLKMDQERDRQGGEPSPLPDELRWERLSSLLARRSPVTTRGCWRNSPAGMM
ncbi:MAG: type I restriction-modification system subunit M N-terminal domain-containing protein [Thermaurantiacus sp.]|uniref:type I restriction-modification system subunit M N-terminal domain-containing protein n=1 Tax=Thermaurantiacus sp. TaxID=2820283 RepID=UPI00298F1479|nr:type I restriction-modification system subunit M N-terminal domain-containing protein [Thermaurantiacus sp.]MDW8415890.1 type I restriction-modification system subunit M N-terminal domain-containing protein [Thermaurantiacus sp.]